MRKLKMMEWILVGTLLAAAVPARAQKFLLAPSSVVAGASGQVVLGKDSNGNTTVDLKVRHLAAAGSMTPSKTVYLVWIKPSGAAAQNKGAITVDSNENGEIKLITPETSFDVIVSAETDANAQTPSDPVVLQGRVQRRH